MQIIKTQHPTLTFKLGEWTPEMQEFTQEFPVLLNKDATVYPSQFFSSEQNMRMATRVMCAMKFDKTAFMNCPNLKNLFTGMKDFAHYLPEKKALAVAKAFGEEIASAVSNPYDDNLRTQTCGILLDMKNQEQNKFRVTVNKKLFDEAARNLYNSQNKIDALSVFEKLNY